MSREIVSQSTSHPVLPAVPPPIPEVMPAVMQGRYSDELATALSLKEALVPRPGKGQVLVRVEAAGVDRGVWHLATGRPFALRLGFGYSGPRQPIQGLDLAGTVAAVGEGVTGFEIGEAVFGTGTGAYAAFALAPATALAHRPAGLEASAAAALPVSGCTALQAVRDHARVRAGQRVLVIGASGGVGSFAVQLAVAAGAGVTGVASAAKHDFVLGLGAMDAIDHAREEINARGGGYDVVIDIAGNRPLGVLRRVLAPHGRLLIVGGEHGGPLLGGIDRQLRAQLIAPFTGQRMGGMLGRTTRADLTALGEAFDGGGLRSVVTRTYPLAEAGAALADLGAGRISGKAVVLVSGPPSPQQR
ncbi:NAD(P)-dependent alcohol dehydrogenase [Sinomonas sp. ASV322]|uniref:NAD(P)-dependent alcohol dehydrogenase n=1 Tax=Sinomonas sp. ASV322 TaxID=3041920 RepID=UPI0027DC0316|nr:NAD(P)-dependent alcohol dehydrogenase [Sinomonas sp. ASV322]MDQ4501563.1 NAD(P)-dependent alcohol dehydrogenase [Sinomonas sp. ASV322]